MAVTPPRRRIFSPLLILYRLAWEPALGLAWCLAGWEKFTPLRRKSWRLADRMAFRRRPPQIQQPSVWLHAASLGESKGLFALAQALSELPFAFVLSASTAAGAEFLSEKLKTLPDPSRWHAAMAPWDHPRVVSRFLRSFRVRAVVLFEMELWPHYIGVAARRNLPVCWVSARWTPRTGRFYWKCPGVLNSLLNKIDWVQTQNESMRIEVLRHRSRNVSLGGDLRGLQYLGSRPDPIPWKERQGVALLSLHAAELPALLPALSALDEKTPVYLFPRKLHEAARFEKELSRLGFTRVTRATSSRRLIVDVFGRISDWLPQCHTAVVGGSFVPRGGHNLWEPLVAGTAMVIGPHYWNQSALADRLIAQGLLRVSARLSAQDLAKPDSDPFPACQRLIQVESEHLQAAVAAVRTELGAALLPRKEMLSTAKAAV